MKFLVLILLLASSAMAQQRLDERDYFPQYEELTPSLPKFQCCASHPVKTACDVTDENLHKILVQHFGPHYRERGPIGPCPPLKLKEAHRGKKMETSH